MYPLSCSALLVRLPSGALVELPIRPDIADALSTRLQSALTEFGHSRLGDLCAQDLIGLLTAAASSDHRPPTAAQIKFGLDISRRLGVELPIGVLQDRAAMGRFLTRYGDALKSASDSRPDVAVGESAATAAPVRAPKQKRKRRRSDAAVSV